MMHNYTRFQGTKIRVFIWLFKILNIGLKVDLITLVGLKLSIGLPSIPLHDVKLKILHSIKLIVSKSVNKIIILKLIFLNQILKAYCVCLFL